MSGSCFLLIFLAKYTYSANNAPICRPTPRKKHFSGCFLFNVFLFFSSSADISSRKKEKHTQIPCEKKNFHQRSTSEETKKYRNGENSKNSKETPTDSSQQQSNNNNNNKTPTRSPTADSSAKPQKQHVSFKRKTFYATTLPTTES